MSEDRDFNFLRAVRGMQPEIEVYPPRIEARLHPEARRLLDERELLEGTGSKDVPRGIIRYGEPGYSIGFGPTRLPSEALDLAAEESRAAERARRAAFVAKREAKRARRLGLAQLANLASQNDTTRPDKA